MHHICIAVHTGNRCYIYNSSVTVFNHFGKNSFCAINNTHYINIKKLTPLVRGCICKWCTTSPQGSIIYKYIYLSKFIFRFLDNSINSFFITYVALKGEYIFRIYLCFLFYSFKCLYINICKYKICTALCKFNRYRPTYSHCCSCDKYSLFIKIHIISSFLLNSYYLL